jgi:hypothetical protein
MTSTSPAYAATRLEAKVQAWSVVKNVLVLAIQTQSHGQRSGSPGLSTLQQSHASSYFAHFLAKPRAIVPPVALPVHEIFLGAHYFAISSTIGTVN